MRADSPSPVTASPGSQRTLLLALFIVFGVLVAATGLLWVSLGSAMFFEIVRAGLAACFG